MAENKGIGLVEASGDIRFEKLSLENKEEYTDFLMEAYKNEFLSHWYKDRDTIKKRWSWEYLEGPYSQEAKPFVWICRAGGRIAAQICVMPVEVKVKDRVYKGGWCQDFIVLPQYRKKGLGAKLVKYATDDSRRYLDIVLAIVASEASYKVFDRAGYINVGLIGRRMKILDGRGMVDALTNRKALRLFLNIGSKLLLGLIDMVCQTGGGAKIDIITLEDFGEDFSSICGEVLKSFPCAIRRDKKSLMRRFVDQSCWRYKIAAAKIGTAIRGYIVLREGKFTQGWFSGIKVGIISDILFDPKEKDVGLSLLEAAVSYFDKKADILRFDFLSRPLNSVARAAGFINIKSRNRFYAYPINDELRREEIMGLISDEDAWHITYGDSDLDLS